MAADRSIGTPTPSRHHPQVKYGAALSITPLPVGQASMDVDKLYRARKRHVRNDMTILECMSSQRFFSTDILAVQEVVEPR